MQCYLVGGAVRDKLLGYPFHERDWVVVGSTPQEMLDAGFQQVGADFPVFLHPKSGEEYALARTERKSGRGYAGFECYAAPDVTLEDDLIRRDLTINAMAQTEAGDVIDPYGGQRDLEQRILRHVSPAFAEDPLRILRVARFYARYHHLGFQVAEETMDLMRAMVEAGEVDFLVPERSWKEIQRALDEPAPEQFIGLLAECGALTRIAPEIAALNPNQWQPALQRAAQQSASGPARFAQLCCALSDGEIRQLCERLRTPNDYRDLALLLQQQATAAAAPNDSEQLLSTLEASDAFRRPERLHALIEALRAHTPEAPALHLLNPALEAALSIKASDLVARGLRGPEVGRELRQQRLSAIQSLL